MAQKRYEMSEEQWLQIQNLFPVAKTGRPPIDNRILFNTILWITRSGSPWRDLPERFGSWKMVYSRFCKWRDDGTLLKIFQILNDEADYENLSIDSTSVKAHQHLTYGQLLSNKMVNRFIFYECLNFRAKVQQKFIFLL